MPSTKPACAGALLTAAIMLLGLAGPASAAPDKGRDATGDVRSRGLTVDTVPRHPEPTRRTGDIVRYRATYGAALVVTTTFRDLAARGDQEFTWFVRTSQDQFEWYVGLVVPAGQNKGDFTLIDPVANQLDCGRAVLDRPGRTVTLRIPASCLGSPSWVKVAHGVRVYTAAREYSDDARRGSVKAAGWKFGPQLAPAP
jgi:hypothetical protein